MLRVLHKYLVIALVMLVTTLSFMGFAAAPARAMLVGTNGVQGAGIIDAPADVTGDGYTNTVIQAFNEAAGVILGHDLAVDHGSVGAGRAVDSHMILLNTAPGVAASAGFTRLGMVTFTFSRRILGVMSDSKGLLETASSAFLGAIGTLYPSDWYWSRGLERTDAYRVEGKTIHVRMGVTSPGDWMRVVTAAPVPLPPGLGLFAVALLMTGGLAVLRRRALRRA